MGKNSFDDKQKKDEAEIARRQKREDALLTQPPDPQAASEPMVLIPAGPFTMGADEQDMDTVCTYQQDGGFFCQRKQFDRLKPKRSVELDAFYIDKHEVTVDAYRECVVAGSCARPPIKPQGYGDFNPDCNWASDRGGNQPINCVTWEQAGAYCSWRQKRLPTEAEWEKAARGTDGRLYAWGDEAPDCDRVVFYDGWNPAGCDKQRSWPVCSKPTDKTAFGLCDMSGNLHEWVADWYSDTYYRSAPVKNPPGPKEAVYKVIRGGSWLDFAPLALSVVWREKLLRGNRDPGVGFRCVSSQPPAQ